MAVSRGAVTSTARLSPVTGSSTMRSFTPISVSPALSGREAPNVAPFPLHLRQTRAVSEALLHAPDIQPVFRMRDGCECIGSWSGSCGGGATLSAARLPPARAEAAALPLENDVSFRLNYGPSLAAHRHTQRAAWRQANST